MFNSKRLKAVCQILPTGTDEKGKKRNKGVLTMTKTETIEYIKDQIDQALFFLTHQAPSFPAEATARRALELRSYQIQLAKLLNS